jgi:multidrug efflux pump subunit AcrA (membrane-fusion protein)
LIVDGETFGTVELALPSEVIGEGHRATMQAVAVAAGAIGEDRRRRRARALEAKQQLVDEVERFTLAVHEKLELQHTAYVIANDGRRLIGADRTAVLVRRGKRYDVAAVSGADVVETRSQASKLLAKLATVAVRTGETVRFTGAGDGLAPQLRTAFNEYVDHAHVKEVTVTPLFPAAAVAEPAKSETPPKPIGALVVETLSDAAPAAGRDERIQLVAVHGATALAKALQHETIPLLPLWRLLGSSRSLLAPGTRSKTIAVLTLLAAAAAALKFIPAPLALSARGTLQPVGRHHVFAPLDGTVKAVHVRHGQHVEPGQLLAELRNTDLEVALADTVGQRTAAYEESLSVERALFEDSSRIAVDERHRLAGRRSELKQRIASLDEQVRLLRRKRELLRITSPIAGEVTTWDVETLLRDRPVKQGQVLVDVADTAGPWELEIQVPEDGIGHVLAAQEEQGPALAVTYRAAAEPRSDRSARLREVHYAAEIRGEEGNTVLAKATLDGELPPLRPGAEATTKIYCGERALGYVWLHDAVDFVRTKVWFRMY